MNEFKDVCPQCAQEIDTHKECRTVHDGYFWHMACLMKHLTQFHSDKLKNDDLVDPYHHIID